MEDFAATTAVPGVAVAASQDGRLVYERGFGWADRERQAPIDGETLFGIGSITKSVTAVAILQLAEQGRLRLDAPASAYLPELSEFLAPQGPGLTLHHFLTHTTGLPPLPLLTSAMAGSMALDPTAQDQLAHLADLGLPPADDRATYLDLLRRLPFPWLGPPGRWFSYSNDAYGLLGAVIERVSGTRYEDYVQRHILEPAGMSRTLFDAKRLSSLDNVATLYARTARSDGSEDPSLPVPSPIWREAPALVAAGFLKSTVRDLLRYLTLFADGGVVGGARLLEPASVRTMTHGHVAVRPGYDYGYGLGVTPYRGLTVIGHSGGLKGISAYVALVPERRWAVAVLMNLAEVAASRVGAALINCWLGLDPDAPLTAIPPTTPPDDLSPYLGRYYSGEDREDIEILARDGALVLHTADAEQILRAAGPEVFVAGSGNEVTWVQPRRRDGRVFAVMVQTRTLPRRCLWDEVGYPVLRPAGV